MHRVLLLGAGKIGRMIAKLLSQAADYDVIVGDVSEQALERIHRQSGVATRVIDARSDARPAAGDRGPRHRHFRTGFPFESTGSGRGRCGGPELL